jgi:Ca-activated chloride channel family protein
MKIEALSDAGDENRDEITGLALEHHLVTPFTSLVAVDVTPAGTPMQTCQTRPVPLTLPAGWGGSAEGSLPGTATPAPLMVLAGALLLLIALVVRHA